MKRKAVVLLLLTALTAPASADFQRGSQAITIYGGGSATPSEYNLNPGGGTDGIANPGYASGGQYLYYLSHSPAFAFGIDASAMHLSTYRSTDLVSGADSSTDLHSNVIQVIEKLSYPQGRWRPYVFGGLGINRSSLSLTAKPLPGQTWRDTGTSESRVFIDNSSTGLAVSWGIGLDIFLNEHFFCGPEYRGISLGNKPFNPTPTAIAMGVNTDFGSILINSLLFRVGYTFGK